MVLALTLLRERATLLCLIGYDYFLKIATNCNRIRKFRVRCFEFQAKYSGRRLGLLVLLKNLFGIERRAADEEG